MKTNPDKEENPEVRKIINRVLPKLRFNVDEHFQTPSVPNEKQIENILKKTVDPGEIKYESNTRPVADSVKVRKSKFLETNEIPQRILSSIEYDHYVKRKLKGNPYTSQSISHYIFNNFIAVQKRDGIIEFEKALTEMKENNIHILGGGFYKFITRVRDIVEILTNNHIGIMEYDEAKFSLKIKNEYL